MEETLVKYLAGLCDADGSLSLKLNKGTVQLHMNMVSAESIDRDGKFFKSLPELTGFGSVQSRYEDHPTWATQNCWNIRSRRDFNMFIPRITKHMVIKATHWDNLYKIFVEYKGVKITQEQFNKLKEISKKSRENTGPLKAKKHPTWAWTCGYTEGDGCFTMKKYSNKLQMNIKVVSHYKDRIGLDLLYKAFGGSITKMGKNCLVWTRALGPKNRSFALKFLAKLVKHAHLKKHKMEQMLNFHHSQRLNKSSPKG